VSKSGSNPGQFDITSDTCNGQVLGGGANCTVTLVFNPTATGTKTASLQVSASPGSSVSATLQGDGQAPADITGSPGGNNFGLVEVGQSTGSINWIVTNNGDVATGTLSFSNSNSSDFPSTNGCSGSLSPGASCTVSVAFSPQAGGSRSATLDLSASPGGSVNLNLNGQGGFRLTVNKNGTGTVTDGGALDCGAACSQVYPAGTNVTVMARTTNGSNAFFSSWSGSGCSGPFRDCTVSMTQARTVSATFSSMDHNLIFVTAGTYAGNLGSATAYDGVCNDVASDAGINNANGDGYIAWISGDNSPASSRLGNAVGWVRMDGRPFSNTQADLLNDGRIYYPVQFNQYGQRVNSNSILMTGTTQTGTTSNQNCNNWTDATQNGTVLLGRAGGGPRYWTGGAGTYCSTAKPILCMGVSHFSQVSPPSNGGLRIFMSNRQLIIGQQTPEQACASSLPSGVNSAKPMIARTNQSADAVLDPGKTYVRPDGAIVGTGAEIAAGDELTSGIWMEGGGTYASQRVWTGHTTLTAKGTSASTCGDWTSTSSSDGRYGLSSAAYSSFWNYFTTDCSGDAWVYCVETP
jgi:hypothetical protein